VKSILKPLTVYLLAVVAVALMRYGEVRGSSVLIPMIWVLGALLFVDREESVASLAGLTRPHLAISLKYYLLSTITIFPIIGGGFWMYYRSGTPPPAMVVPPGVSIAEWILYQFAMVAAFEELFFRGYLQKQFERISSAMQSGEMTVFWLPVIASAFLFALAHVIVELDPLRIATFFPGLLFAWLRARTGSLIAPVLSHGSANVFALFFL
jgi:membrane protease YdiL (CAAX protease family)